jgi:alcohol dehydrogenase class IV
LGARGPDELLPPFNHPQVGTRLAFNQENELKHFNYQHPTEIIFGYGRFAEIGSIVARFGRRCILVSGPKTGALRDVYSEAKKLLGRAGVESEQFDGVIPNPTVGTVSQGAKIAKAFRADVVLGIGGGSSLDSAKAISVEATHDGSCWDYLFFKQKPTDRTLPVIAVGTTAGTGSQVTQVAVVTDTATRDKSALYDNHLIPRVALVDPALTLSVPAKTTAVTGFDVFCHAFESTLNPGSNLMSELAAWEAIQRVITDLPALVRDGRDLRARSSLAWADTLAGLSICAAGVTLPHGIAMAIGGMYPSVAHGAALASIYPACMDFTWESAIAQFAQLARILDPSLHEASDEKAAQFSPRLMEKFLDRVDLNDSLKQLGVPEEELPALAKQSMVLPDYTQNPKVPTANEMLSIISQSF